jgi:hypothetical protein
MAFEETTAPQEEAPTTQAAWVIFTADGIPAWYGPDQVEGSEWVEDLPVNAAELRRVNGRWEKRPVLPPPTDDEIEARLAAQLTRRREEALGAVDELIQATRLRFVTPLAGQEAIYLAKEAEARAYVALVPPPPDLSEFPYLSAEIGITAPDAHRLAQLWLQRGALFRGLGARTEHLRMATRKAIATADWETIDATMNDLVAQLAALG